MLDFSVSEIGLVGLVALVAIGPERLPKVARAAGVLFGRFRRYANSVKAEIEREIQQSELQGLQQRMNEAAREVQQQVAHSSAEVQTLLNTPAIPSEPSPTPPLIPGFSPPQPDLVPPVPPSAPGLSANPVITFSGDTSPFGGDPFSVRGAPRRSKPMTPQSARIEAAISLEDATSPVSMPGDKADLSPEADPQAVSESPSS